MIDELQESKLDQGFAEISEKSLDVIMRNRMLDRDNYTQQTMVEGENKAIILTDGVNNRILIGYQKDGF